MIADDHRFFVGDFVLADLRRASILDRNAMVERRSLAGRELRFSVLASGSSGNALFVEPLHGSPGFLIDAGLTFKRLRPLLGSIGKNAGDIAAVLLTHGHSDHTCGLRTMRRAMGNLPVYCAPGVGETLGAEVMEADFEVCGARASFFPVPHDAPTYGVKIETDGISMATATDLGFVPPGVLDLLCGVDALVLEANHDAQWLRSGPYPARLKRRISSENGHLSNDQAAEVALALAPHGLKDVVLAHLSETNNSPARATGAVSLKLRSHGFANVRVRAALRRHPTPWIEVGATPPQSKENVYRDPDEGSGQLFGTA